MKQGIKIAISGKSGCGNTTVSRLVAEKLGLELINYTFHTMADEEGIDFRELYRKAQTDLNYDRHLDRRQVEMAEKGDCVLGSRLAIWMLEDADLKVFLDAPIEVRAERIQQREGGSFDEVLEETRRRDENDSSRFMKLYNIDNNDFGFADVILDVGTMDQYEAAERIAAEARKIS